MTAKPVFSTPILSARQVNALSNWQNAVHGAGIAVSCPQALLDMGTDHAIEHLFTGYVIHVHQSAATAHEYLYYDVELDNATDPTAPSYMRIFYGDATTIDPTVTAAAIATITHAGSGAYRVRGRVDLSTITTPPTDMQLRTVSIYIYRSADGSPPVTTGRIYWLDEIPYPTGYTALNSATALIDAQTTTAPTDLQHLADNLASLENLSRTFVHGFRCLRMDVFNNDEHSMGVWRWRTNMRGKLYYRIEFLHLQHRPSDFFYVKFRVGAVASPTSVGLAATTVDATSASGQTVLSVASTTGFVVDDVVCINDGGARVEHVVVASIQAGVSLTLRDNLTYTHTAAQADTVVSCVAVTYGSSEDDPVVKTGTITLASISPTPMQQMAIRLQVLVGHVGDRGYGTAAIHFLGETGTAVNSYAEFGKAAHLVAVHGSTSTNKLRTLWDSQKLLAGDSGTGYGTDGYNPTGAPPDGGYPVGYAMAHGRNTIIEGARRTNVAPRGLRDVIHMDGRECQAICLMRTNLPYLYVRGVEAELVYFTGESKDRDDKNKYKITTSTQGIDPWKNDDHGYIVIDMTGLQAIAPGELYFVRAFLDNSLKDPLPQDDPSLDFAMEGPA